MLKKNLCRHLLIVGLFDQFECNNEEGGTSISGSKNVPNRLPIPILESTDVESRQAYREGVEIKISVVEIHAYDIVWFESHFLALGRISKVFFPLVVCRELWRIVDAFEKDSSVVCYVL